MPGDWRQRAIPAQASQKDGGWRSRAIQVEPEPEPVSELESAGRGLLQGVSLGFSDEIAGGIGAGVDLLSDRTSVDDIGGSYRKHQQESQQANDAAKDQNPKTYYGAEVAGGVGSMFVPGLGVGKGAKAIYDIGRLGALSGIGHSESSDPKDQLVEGAIGGASSAAMGLGMNKLAETSIGKKVGDFAGDKTKAVYDYLLEKRNNLSNKAAGATQVDLKKMDLAPPVNGKPLRQAAGAALFESGAVTPFSSAKSILRNVEPLTEKAGRDLGEHVARIEGIVDDMPVEVRSFSTVDGDTVADKIEEQIIGKMKLKDDPGLGDVGQYIQQVADSFRRHPNMSISEAVSRRINFDKKLKGTWTRDTPVKGDLLKQVRGILDGTIDEAVVSIEAASLAKQKYPDMPLTESLEKIANQLHGGSGSGEIFDQLNQYNKAKGTYRGLVTGEGIAEKGVQRLEGNNAWSPRDIGTSLATVVASTVAGKTMSEGALLTVAALLASQLSRKVGPSVAANMAHQAAEAVAKFGPHGVQQLPFAVSQSISDAIKSDPRLESFFNGK